MEQVKEQVNKKGSGNTQEKKVFKFESFKANDEQWGRIQTFEKSNIIALSK